MRNHHQRESLLEFNAHAIAPATMSIIKAILVPFTGIYSLSDISVKVKRNVNIQKYA